VEGVLTSERAQRLTELLRATRVYAVTDDAATDVRLFQVVDGLIGAGLRVFQYRDKLKVDRARVQIVRALSERVHAVGGLLIVNDRTDLAIAGGADGAHLGQRDLPLDSGRLLLGPDLLLGASASYLEEIGPAVSMGADYLGFGAVFPTDTKPDAEYAGLELLRQACAASSVPVVGIGGITVGRAPSVVGCGAAAVAVVSALFRSSDPADAARQLVAALR
jgi:thiamine-phosphate pyrophosphorylase